jgi:hypothetical protein
MAYDILGIRHARFYEMLKESNGAIKTCLIRSPGAARGCRMVNIPSVYAYLDQLAAERMAEKAGAGGNE